MKYRAIIDCCDGFGRTAASGDRVAILEGPFARLEGIFQCEQGEQRALILLECLNSLTQLTVSRHHLNRAS